MRPVQRSSLFLAAVFSLPSCNRKEDTDTISTNPSSSTGGSDSGASSGDLSGGQTTSTTASSGPEPTTELTTETMDPSSNPACDAWVEHEIDCAPRFAEGAEMYRMGCNQEILEGFAQGMACGQAVENYYLCRSQVPCDFVGESCMTESQAILTACP